MSLKAFIAGLTLKMKIIFAFAAIAVVGGTAAVVGYNVTKEDAYRVLKVFEMEGASIVSREGSGDLEAYVGMNLESGDVLSVGDESTLRVVLDNDSTFCSTAELCLSLMLRELRLTAELP